MSFRRVFADKFTRLIGRVTPGIDLGQSGIWCDRDGEHLKWRKIDGTDRELATIPEQTSNAGKVLSTDGDDLEWVAQSDGLPTQTDNAGKVLKTNGTAASWGHITRWFNVLDYGAVADGATDDGPAFQAAFEAALAAGGGTVYAPRGTYRITTGFTIANGGAYTPQLRLVGDGTSTVIVPVMPLRAYALNFASLNLSIENLRFDGTTAGDNAANAYLIAVSYGECVLRDVEFDDILVAGGLLVVYGGRTLLDHVTVGNDVVTSTALGNAFFSSLDSAGFGVQSFVARDCTFATHGNFYPNTASAIYITTPIYPNGSFTAQGEIVIERCSFGDVCNYQHVYVDPASDKRWRGIVVRDSAFHTTDFATRPEGNRAAGFLRVARTDHAVVERCWSGYGGIETYRAAIVFVDAGDAVVAHCHFDGDDAFRAPIQGTRWISADSTTRSLTVIDSTYDAIESACPTVVVKDGVRARLRKATAVPANTLVKPDASNAGQVVPLGTGDAAALRCGVAIDGSAKAAATVTFDAAFAITEGDDFPLFDGTNAAKTVVFTLSGASYPGQVVVSVTNGMTAPQRATALANAINAAHGSGFKFTASALGGVCTITNDDEGIVGNRPIAYAWGTSPDGTISAVAGAIVINGMGGGRSYTRVAGPGEEVSVKSDGTTVIAPGDLVERSSTSAGRIVKGSTTPVGVAVGSGAASADVLVKVVLR